MAAEQPASNRFAAVCRNGNGQFSAAVFGGINSIPGTILGGVIIGLLENLAGGYISSAYKDLVAFVILLLTLVVWPNGLLGRATPVKV